MPGCGNTKVSNKTVVYEVMINLVFYEQHFIKEIEFA
jgi:hypothetical protein